jgi:ABC-2 type transport system permease protein
LIFAKTLRDEAVKSLVFSAVTTGALTLAVLYYPTFAENRGLIARLVPVFVKGMVADVLKDEYLGYFVFQHYVKGLLFISAAAAVFIGMGAVSKEVETGTIQVLLSKPVSRTRVLLGKFAALAIATAAPVVLSSLAGIALSRAIGETVPIEPTLLACLHATFFAWSLLAVTVLSSVVFDEQIKAGGWAGVACLSQIVLFLSDNTRRYSFFDYASYGSYRRIFVDGSYPWRDSIVLLATAIAALAVAVWAFRRKDL